jgi:integrase/recombinase XerD
VSKFKWAGTRKYLNAGERNTFRLSVESESDPARRAFCLVLFYTGCRISEALELTAERVDLSSKIVIFETLKRRQRGLYRAVVIPDFLARLLEHVLTGVEPSCRVWNFSRPTAYRLVKRHMAAAGIGGIQACPKGLRHAFAVACLNQQIPLTKLQKWMGHAKLDTTAIYLDVMGEEEKKLAEKLWAADELPSPDNVRLEYIPRYPNAAEPYSDNTSPHNNQWQSHIQQQKWGEENVLKPAFGHLRTALQPKASYRIHQRTPYSDNTQAQDKSHWDEKKREPSGTSMDCTRYCRNRIEPE